MILNRSKFRVTCFITKIRSKVFESIAVGGNLTSMARGSFEIHRRAPDKHRKAKANIVKDVVRVRKEMLT